MVNFPEPEVKRTSFTSDQKNTTHYFLFQMGLFYVNNSSRICLSQNYTFLSYENQLREKYFDYLLKSLKNWVKLRIKIPN